MSRKKDDRMILADSKKTQRNTGFSLIELLVVIAIIAIPILAVGILLSGASRGWQKIYNDTNSEIQQDAAAVLASLQTFGRQANITNYQVYKIQNNSFTVAVPPNGQTVAVGQAVEFRYWQNSFDPANPGSDLLDTANTGTNYVLYYLDGNQLKADFGAVINGVGGVTNNARRTANITSTQILAHNVDIPKTTCLFSHTLVGGQGSGCVNTDLTLTNQQKVSVDVTFATMLRSAWPR
jgi:prepilin-type N-terminal cleavage/methylation domain-containing protein